MSPEQNRPIAVIAGGTRGIGLALAEKLAARGTHLGIVARSQASGARAVEAIRRAGGTVDIWRADLSEISEVVRVAGEIEAAYPRLDLLVQCADNLSLSRGETSDGVDRSFATNYVSRFAMVERLSPLLRSSAPSTVLHVALAGMAKRFDSGRVPPPPSMSAMAAHQTGQAANDVFGVELYERLKESSVRVIVTNPGMVNTDIRRRAMPFVGALMDFVMAPFLVSADDYADVLLGILDGDDGGPLYDRKGRPLAVPAAIGDASLRAEVWARTEALVRRAEASAAGTTHRA